MSAHHTPILTLLIALLTGAAEGTTTPASEVFLNEIHYDNAAADRGEALEVVAPTGAVIPGYRVVLYNGANGRVYRSYDLSSFAATADPTNGRTFYVRSVPGIQNGPDGVALIDDAGTVIEFLSYEGIFTAVDGPANGLSSTEIGVAEGNDTPEGSSLQRGGSGPTAGDQSWGDPAPSTFGRENGSQSVPVELLSYVIE